VRVRLGRYGELSWQHRQPRLCTAAVEEGVEEEEEVVEVEEALR